MAAMKSRSSCVRITDESLAADWVRRQARSFGRPLSAIQIQGRPVQLFAENELLVRDDDSAAIGQLQSRYGATVEHPRPIPAQPEGMDPERRRSVDGMPRYARVRFAGERVSLDSLDARAAEARRERPLEVTSRAGAGTLALAALLRGEGRRVMVNSVGSSHALPGSASTEGAMWDGSTDAYQLPQFSGPTRVARAWQLFNAYSRVKSISSPVFLGIFDAGFAFDAQGNFPSGDLPPLVRYNLNAEGQSAGGPNNEAGKEWHGTGTVSVAGAIVGNSMGAAGSGGLTSSANLPIVVPVLFKTLRSADEVIRGLELSVAWGVDVVNISFSITHHWPSTESDEWDDAFQFAADQGVVLVVSAGNSGLDLPDDAVVVPATRTPGTITVGWLDAGSMKAHGSSNYGSSVDIWAPGTNLHVIPEFPGGRFSGTSAAAPLTAGIVSLMKAIQPALTTGTVKDILRDTAYHPGDPKVTAALDAYAALLRTMGDQLPSGTNEEPNHSPQLARTIVPGPTGALAPIGDTTISQASDVDWWHFSLNQYSTCIVSATFVPELSTLWAELVPDDPESPVPGKVTMTKANGEVRLSTGVAPPGGYKLMIRGSAPNIYELRVSVTPRPLTPDSFEVNDSFETAAQFSMAPTTGSMAAPLVRRWSPGAYEANLHVASDLDFFHIVDIPLTALVVCTFQIIESDAPLDVTVFRSDRTVHTQANGIRTGSFELPGPDCWVRVSGATANQYVFRVWSKQNDSIIPPLVDNDPLDVPHWWPDPPFRLNEWEQYLRVDVTPELKEIGRLRLTGSPGLTLDVISPATGEVVASGLNSVALMPGDVEVDVSGLAEGTHLLRVGRSLDASDRTHRRLSRAVAAYTIGPAW